MQSTGSARFLALSLGMAATALFAGCGGPADELPREPISGSVIFAGKPLKAGLIQFQPADQATTTAGGTGVAEGSYWIAKSEGLVPGRYQVLVTSNPPAATVPPGPPGDPVGPPKETIPPRYNIKTELTAEVKKGGPNKFDFDLKPK
jgi:hypothetical protein